jgi:uncharacterized protein YPO0396
MPGMPLASVNWTIIATSAVTGLTALLVGVIGVYATKLTAGVTRRQIDAETERLDKANAEAHLQHRQGVYHNLLNAERRTFSVIKDRSTTTRDRVDALWSLYDHVNGAAIFGTEEVAGKAIALAQILNRWRASVEAGIDMTRASGEEWVSARRELIDAMRRDVSVDQTSISFWPTRPGSPSSQSAE